MQRQIPVALDNGINGQVADGDLSSEKLCNTFWHFTNLDPVNALGVQLSRKFHNSVIRQIGDMPLVGNIYNFPKQVGIGEDIFDDLRCIGLVKLISSASEHNASISWTISNTGMVFRAAWANPPGPLFTA